MDADKKSFKRQGTWQWTIGAAVMAVGLLMMLTPDEFIRLKADLDAIVEFITKLREEVNQ